MAEFKWDVQPYALVSELINAYTRVVISTTRNQAKKRAEEAETWMRQNAPWRDRSEVERQARIDLGYKDVSNRHAREALSVSPVVDPNIERQFQAMERKAYAADIKALKAENVSRAARNVGRYESRKLAPLEHLPKSRSQGPTIAQKIRVIRGPIVELRFSHGDDIKYGIWLEIAHGGKYGIISKAIGHWGPILFNDVDRISRLKQFDFTFSEEVVTEEERFLQHVEAKNREFMESGESRRYEPWSAEIQAAKRPGKRKYRERKRREAEVLVKIQEGLDKAKREQIAKAQKSVESQIGGWLVENPRTREFNVKKRR